MRPFPAMGVRLVAICTRASVGDMRRSGHSALLLLTCDKHVPGNQRFLRVLGVSSLLIFPVNKRAHHGVQVQRWLFRARWRQLRALPSRHAQECGRTGRLRELCRRQILSQCDKHVASIVLAVSSQFIVGCRQPQLLVLQGLHWFSRDMPTVLCRDVQGREWIFALPVLSGEYGFS